MNYKQLRGVTMSLTKKVEVRVNEDDYEKVKKAKKKLKEMKKKGTSTKDFNDKLREFIKDIIKE